MHDKRGPGCAHLREEYVKQKVNCTLGVVRIEDPRASCVVGADKGTEKRYLRDLQGLGKP